MTNLEKEISEISTLRESKGREQETLEKISELLPNAIEAEEWKSVAKLYWESHLVWQHTAMTEMSKPKQDQDKKIIKQGSEKMLEFAEKAKDVIESHDIEDMAGGAYRFLGRSATFSGDHAKAKEYYETALSKYLGKNLKSKLEVSGFLADSIIRLGQPEIGLSLAIKTYDDFYNSELGQDLKKEDYFTWAVWMSGIAPRIGAALLDTNADFDRAQLVSWLNQAKSELENPTGTVTWGDKDFEFRINELNSILERIT